MKAQHTPGPWKSVETPTRKHTAFVICTENAAPFQAVICDVDKASAHHKEHIYRSEANARLIAAAPELLEACKAIVNDLENNGEVFVTDDRRIAFLSEVIAKATGQ